MRGLVRCHLTRFVLRWLTAAFKYVVDNAAELGVDATRLGIGGFSSGGNLAAMVSQRAGLEGVAINFVVLSVPLTDNTATADSYSSWDVNRNCPGLSVEKMLWCRSALCPIVLPENQY